MIVQHVRAQLTAKGHKLRGELVAESNDLIENGHGILPTSMHILPMTPQIRGLHSFIRNKNTPRDEFTFYAKRLIRIVIEHALSLMPYQSVTVSTYTNKTKDWALVQNAALVINIKELKLG